MVEHGGAEPVGGLARGAERRNAKPLEHARERRGEQRPLRGQHPKIVRERRGIRTEQRFRHDRERQLIHGGAHVDHLAVGPLLGRGSRQRRHRRAVGRELTAAERGLQRPALGMMALALAGEEPVAQQPAGALHQAALPELVGVVHQHLAHVVGMREEERVPAAEPERGDVALLPGEPQRGSHWCRARTRARGRAAAARASEGRSPRRRAVQSRAPRWRSNPDADRHGIRRPNERSGWARSWLSGVSCTNSPPGASTRAISASACAARAMW